MKFQGVEWRVWIVTQPLQGSELEMIILRIDALLCNLIYAMRNLRVNKYILRERTLRLVIYRPWWNLESLKIRKKLINLNIKCELSPVIVLSCPTPIVISIYDWSSFIQTSNYHSHTRHRSILLWSFGHPKHQKLSPLITKTLKIICKMSNSPKNVIVYII